MVFRIFLAAWELWPFEMMRAEQNLIFIMSKTHHTLHRSSISNFKIFDTASANFNFKSFSSTDMSASSPVSHSRLSCWMQYSLQFKSRFYAWCWNEASEDCFFNSSIDHCFDQHTRPAIPQSRSSCTFIILFITQEIRSPHFSSALHIRLSISVCFSFCRKPTIRDSQFAMHIFSQ